MVSRKAIPDPNSVDPAVITGRISNILKNVAEDREEELDKEIERLDNLKEDDLEHIREKRRQEHKRDQNRKAKFLAMGHGEYSECPGEVEFFDIARNCPKVVAHFYKPDTNIERIQILDKHLSVLAAELIDIRFIRVNVEKHPFMTSRMHIYVIPSMVLVKEQQLFHTMIGFEEMGAKDDFTTKELTAALKKWGMLEPFDPDWRKNRPEIIEDNSRDLD